MIACWHLILYWQQTSEAFPQGLSPAGSYQAHYQCTKTHVTMTQNIDIQ